MPRPSVLQSENKMPKVFKINFLSQKQLRLRRQAKRLLKLQTPAIILVVINIVILIGLLGYSFFLGYQKTLWEQKEKIVLSDIKQLSSVETKHVFIKSKLDKLTSIFESSQKHQDLAEAVLSLLPSGMTIQGLSIENQGYVSFSAEAQSFNEVKEFLSNIRQGELRPPTVKIQFSQIKEVGLKSDGSYSLTIVMKMESLPIL